MSSSISRLAPAARSYADDLTTASGSTSRMVWVPQFRCQDIHPALGSGVHPAFIVNGSEIPGFWVGMYPGRVVDGELLSLEGVDPTVSLHFDEFSTAARQCGPGWHLVTNAEWAAVALWALAAGTPERGNDDYGRSHNATSETGRRQDRMPIGRASGEARTLTGSGPDTWRHDGTGEGVADLVGNVWEWVGGLRLDQADIQVIADNDAVIADMSAGSTDWVSTGYRWTTPAVGSNAAFNAAVAVDEDDNAPEGADLELLRRLALLPLPEDMRSTRGRLYQGTLGERLPIRGGSWTSSSGAGRFALNLISSRSTRSVLRGGRPAFVEL